MYITMDIALCYNHHNPPHPCVDNNYYYIAHVHTHTGFVRSAVVVCCRSYSALLGNLQITYRYLLHLYMIINKRRRIDHSKSTSKHVFLYVYKLSLIVSLIEQSAVSFRAWLFINWSHGGGLTRKSRQGSTKWQFVVRNVIICLKVKAK